VQRVIADASVYDRLVPRVVAAVEAQVTGDPNDDKTDVGPLISEDAAKRVEAWVDEAVAAGATLRTGGKRDGASYAPTVLTDVPADVTLSCEEVFGPVLTMQKVDGEAAAFDAVNDSKYGLQAGVFTHDLQAAFRAHRALEVGGVVIGDVPSYRADQMPYGGAKQSGVGRAGVRFAMEDYTYERVMVPTGLALSAPCRPVRRGPAPEPSGAGPLRRCPRLAPARPGRYRPNGRTKGGASATNRV